MEALAETKEPKKLDWQEKQKTSYCIPAWLRNEQIRHSITRTPNRIQPGEVRSDPIAIVCFGPSLADTWEKIRDFKYIMTCSGAHKFLRDRGITPTHHADVDPREHKVVLIGEPCKETEYLIASACHPKMWDHLADYKTTLWHIFDNEEEGMRILPPKEWALTGGCGAGIRAMLLARFLGFTNQHVFGMDGNIRETSHAAEHPNQPPKKFFTEYEGVTYWTTPAYLEAARSTRSELDKLPDVNAVFYGEGLVQHMAKDHQRKIEGPAIIGMSKPELISAEYRDLNAKMHRECMTYGIGGGRHAERVIKMVEAIQKTQGRFPSILDYGCGRGYLAKALPWAIWEYDPAIPEKAEPPRAADLVLCTDVLEHIEPEKLDYVLDDLRRCTKAVGFFWIHTGAATKTLPDGRNTHLIQKPRQWWAKRIKKHFNLEKMIVADKTPEVGFIVYPKEGKRTVNAVKAG